MYDQHVPPLDPLTSIPIACKELSNGFYCTLERYY
jgi:hypothetical protein